MSTMNGLDPAAAPDMMVDVRNTFGLDVAMTVPAFSRPNEYVPDLDTAYVFDRETTLAILAGFAHNRRAYVFRPEDHSLPVLRVTDASGKVRAVLASYACHCTTQGFNRVHGDWAGCAQEEIEKVYRSVPGIGEVVART